MDKESFTSYHGNLNLCFQRSVAGLFDEHQYGCIGGQKEQYSHHGKLYP
jgi:hypothetical protein